MSLDHLTKNAEEERAVKLKADAALNEGLISRKEYDYFLKEELGIEQPTNPHNERVEQASHRDRRKETLLKFAAVLVGLGLIATLLWFNTGTGITGYVAYDTTTNMSVGERFTGNASITLNATNITSISVTGSAAGTGSLHLRYGQEELLIYEFTTETYGVTTNKESYALNSRVNVNVTPPEAAYTLWLEDALGERTIVRDAFNVTRQGNYSIDALINDSGNITITSSAFTVRNDTNASNDILRETNKTERDVFADECIETCTIPPTGNETLQVLVNVDGTITIDAFSFKRPSKENEPPRQTTALPDITLVEGDSTSLQLDLYFTDPEQERLTYDYMNIAGVEMEVEEGVLTLTGRAVGEGESRIYASDLATLIESNRFTITVTGSEENQSVGENETTEENGAAPVNGTTLNETTPVPQDLCNHPDPNKRPIECLQEEPAQYFQPQQLLIQDNKRRTVGRLSPIGNLLIKGEVRTGATGEPAAEDYSLGYRNTYGEYQPTLWIDSTTGDLHLRGSIVEEDIYGEPPRGATVMKNKRGIILAWVERERGSLHLRGNLISGRGELS